ncbi:hypothetical protein D3C75_573480 [compost metagenome]
MLGFLAKASLAIVPSGLARLDLTSSGYVAYRTARLSFKCPIVGIPHGYCHCER